MGAGMMCMIELKSVDEFVGPFESETEAYAYADKYYGELNGDEFVVRNLNSPKDAPADWPRA